MNKNYLTTNGIAYDEGVERLMGNTVIYESLLMDFVDDFSFENITQAYNEKDFTKLFKQVHTLKGISGSLGLNILYKKCCTITKTLQAANYSDIESLYLSLLKIYNDTVSIIKTSNSYDNNDIIYSK